MRKQRIISFLLTLRMVFSLLPVSALAASVEDFTDVSKDSWYYKEVDWVADNGYFKGTSETTFEPDAAMTRAMFVTVLARYAGAKVNDTTSTFTDVPANEWYTGAVTWAAQNKIVEGRGNGIFDPHTSVTREEMCTILDRYLVASGLTAKLTKTPATITDMDTVSSWAKAAVEDCVDYGVIYGYPDGTFLPKETATRAHVAALLYRLQLKVSGGGGTGGYTPPTITILGNGSTSYGEYAEMTITDNGDGTSTLTITVKDHYAFVSLFVDGKDKTSDVNQTSAMVYTYTFNTGTVSLFSANFANDTHVVTIKAEGKGSVAATYTNPVTCGTEIEITATADENNSLTGWTMNGTAVNGTATTYKVKIDKNLGIATGEAVEIVATFTNNEQPGDTVTVTVTANDDTMGTVTGGGTKDKGSDFTLTATPAAGYHFVNWTEDGKTPVTDNSYTLTNVTEDRALVGNFALNDPDKVTVSVVSLNTEWGTALVNNKASDYVIKGTEVIAVATPVMLITISLAGRLPS